MGKDQKIDDSTKDHVSFFQTEIKTNNVPFDETRHKQLLNFGIMSYTLEQDALFINKRTSNAAGFGTASMRELVGISLSKRDGKIRTQAAWSSHIFHLKMGMIPEQKSTFYVKTMYGFCGLSCIREIIALSSVVELSKNNLLIEEFKWIYRLEYKLEAEKEVSNQDLFESIPYFKDLLNKKIDYLQHDFIPDLLGVLKGSIGNNRPDTSTWGSIVMSLSPLGKERWQNAINRKIEFQPFRDFAHLHPYMTPGQRKELTEILIQHEAALKKTSDESTYIFGQEG